MHRGFHRISYFAVLVALFYALSSDTAHAACDSGLERVTESVNQETGDLVETRIEQCLCGTWIIIEQRKYKRICDGAVLLNHYTHKAGFVEYHRQSGICDVGQIGLSDFGYEEAPEKEIVCNNNRCMPEIYSFSCEKYLSLDTRKEWDCAPDQNDALRCNLTFSTSRTFHLEYTPCPNPERIVVPDGITIQAPPELNATLKRGVAEIACWAELAH